MAIGAAQVAVQTAVHAVTAGVDLVQEASQVVMNPAYTVSKSLA